MEQLMNEHTEREPDTWTPWEADEELYWMIMTNQLIPPVWGWASVIPMHRSAMAA